MKAKVIVINIIIFAGLLLAVEFGALLWNSSHGKPALTRTSTTKYRVIDPVLGRYHKANIKTTVTGTYQSRIQYVVNYEFDEFARRITPLPKHGKRLNHALFLGCSNVFGPPVENDETIPAWFSKLNPEYKSYNYGVPGWGLSHVLAHLEHKQLEGREVPEPEGVGFYFFFDYHLNRSIPSKDTATWVPNSPFYAIENGTPAYKGLISGVKPWPYLLYRFFYSLNLVNALEVGLGSHSEYDMNYQIRLLNKVRSEYYRQFPKGDFQLVVDRASLTPELSQALNREVFPFIVFDIPDVNTMVVEHDGHYNSPGNKKVAEQVSKTYFNGKK